MVGDSNGVSGRFYTSGAIKEALKGFGTAFYGRFTELKNILPKFFTKKTSFSQKKRTFATERNCAFFRLMTFSETFYFGCMTKELFI